MSNSTDENPAICPHGKLWVTCKEKECVEEMIRVEDEAYCPHGFLAGCPVCSGETLKVDEDATRV